MCVCPARRPPPIQVGNSISNFDMDTNPLHPVLVQAGSQGNSWADRALQGVNHNQWAPRFGFAYSLPDNKTVLRGGYGIFYSGVQNPGGMQSLEINAPYHVQVQLSPSPTVPSLTFATGFAPNALSLANASNVLSVSDDTGSK